MSLFAILSVLVTLAALFGFISRRVLHLPATIGTMLLTLGCSFAMLIAGFRTPVLQRWAFAMVERIDFNAVVLHGILGLLLFAGSLHLDLEQLRKERLTVSLLSILSTALSTVLIGAGLKGLLFVAHVPATWLLCLLFGALISPTDPVAVLEMLGRVHAPRALKSQLAGESLFNDGVGAVFFLSLLAASSGGSLPTAGHFLWTLALQAGGGITLGLALSYGTYRLLRSIDDHRVEVLLTLALAMGGYAIADRLGVSMPLEAVAAGLLINGHGRRFGMSPKSRSHVDQFWSTTDDLLNALLFLLLGLEVLSIPLPAHRLLLGLAVVPIALAARWLSVAAVLAPLRALVHRGWLHAFSAGTLKVLTWGGLRGGLSVALALSLPRNDARDLLLTLTYVVVVCSVAGQGLTVGKLLRRVSVPEGEPVPHLT